MLEYLRIRNLALIEDAELDFAPGMNVLTGETGAGKSFILKALGFLLGDRLGADMVRQGAEKAQVEAQFQMDGREIVIRRSLLAESGRSRLYVDDALRSQECVRSLREQLLAHASQHGQQQLLQPAFQARLMESTLKDPDLLRRRDELLEQLRSVEARRKELRAREAHLLERRDILEMQQQEIDRVAPEAGEEERLEEQRAIVRAAEQTREQYELALGLLHGEEEPGLLDMLGRLERCLHQMARTDDSVSEDADAVTALRQQLSHLSGRLRRPPLPEDMPDVEQMEERLYALAQLKRKLHRSLDEILELREEIRENISFLDACGTRKKNSWPPSCRRCFPRCFPSAAKLPRTLPDSWKKNCASWDSPNRSGSSPISCRRKSGPASWMKRCVSSGPPTPGRLPSRWTGSLRAASFPASCSP